MAQPVDQEELSWEEAGVQELQKLSLKHEEPQAQQALEQAPSGTPNAATTAGPTPDQDARERPPVDPAIIEALQKGREADRKTITEIESMVIKFIGDTSRDILEFPSTFGTYQKMLAHRVAQAYGLQTSTVDYEDGHGRVIGSRTRETRLRKVRLTKMDLSAPEYQLQSQGDRSGAPKVLFRRPGAGLHDYRSSAGGEYLKPSNSSQSMKEREEDYNRARERLGIGAPTDAQPSPAMYAGGRANHTFQGGRGGYGRGPIMQGRDVGGRGRGRKAVFRDRDRELQDPDYVRGYSRDGSQQPYEPGEYSGMEGSGYTEYGAMQSWGSGGQFRAPPPPPPPHPTGPYPAAAPHKAAGMPASPAAMQGMAIYPAAPGMAQAVGQPQMAAMPRPSFPAGLPMAAYPMPGYPGPMGYAAMPGQQAAMYAAPGLAHAYSAQMGAAYGYMDASGGQDVAAMAASHAGGGYPMYAGYALYPQPHMAAMPGGMRAMPMPGMPPGPGMEHMYPGVGGYAYAMAQQGSAGHAPAGDGKHQHQQGGRAHSGHGGTGGHNGHEGGGGGGGGGAGAHRQDSSSLNSN